MILINIICIFCMALAISCTYILIRMCVAYENRAVMYESIYAYIRDMTKRGEFNYEVGYYDMEPFHATVLRLFDFGCTNILPKEQYEIIKPYIDKVKENSDEDAKVS